MSRGSRETSSGGGNRLGWKATLEHRVSAGFAPGIVGLVERGGAVFVHAAGLRDIAASVPMDVDSVFRIASVSKPITAAGAMLLVDQGMLELDEPLDHWLPELADRRVLRVIDAGLNDTVEASAPVTLRGLLSMTFGLGFDFGFRSAVSDRLRAMQIAPFGFPFDADEYLTRLESVPLLSQPGERWLYHIGLDVTGVLIERVSGERLGDYLRRRLFEPLGMRDTGFILTRAQQARLARLYMRAGDSFVEIPDGSPRTVARPMEQGGSELLSTARDLAAFGRMLLNGGSFAGRRILSAAAVAEMTRDQVSDAAKARSPVFPGFWDSHGWGLGMCVVTGPNAVSDTPGRFGWWGGTGTALFVDPTADAIMVMLSQLMIRDISDSANADAMFHAVLEPQATGLASTGA